MVHSNINPDNNLRLAVAFYTSNAFQGKPHEEDFLFKKLEFNKIVDFLSRLNGICTPQTIAAVLRRWFEIDVQTTNDLYPIKQFDQLLEKYYTWSNASDYHNSNNFIFDRENIFGGLSLLIADLPLEHSAFLIKKIVNSYPHLAGTLFHLGLERATAVEIIKSLNSNEKRLLLRELTLSAAVYYPARKNENTDRTDNLLSIISELALQNEKYILTLLANLSEKEVAEMLDKFAGLEYTSGNVLPIPALFRNRNKSEKAAPSLFNTRFGEFLKFALRKQISVNTNGYPPKYHVGSDAFYFHITDPNGEPLDRDISIWTLFNSKLPLGYTITINGVGTKGNLLLQLNNEKPIDEAFLDSYLDKTKMLLLWGTEWGKSFINEIRERLKSGKLFALNGDTRNAVDWFLRDPAWRNTALVELMTIKLLIERGSNYVLDGVEYQIQNAIYIPRSKQFVVSLKSKPTGLKNSITLDDFFNRWQIV